MVGRITGAGCDSGKSQDDTAGAGDDWPEKRNLLPY